jgi:hypothetical protein
MPTDDDLRSQIFALSASERAGLVRLLLLSLEGDSFDDEVQQAWAAESERRSAAHRQSESQSRDWRAAIDDMRGEIKRRRSS